MAGVDGSRTPNHPLTLYIRTLTQYYILRFLCLFLSSRAFDPFDSSEVLLRWEHRSKVSFIDF